MSDLWNPTMKTQSILSKAQLPKDFAQWETNEDMGKTHLAKN